MKFKVDENVGEGAAEFFRAFGYDVSTVRHQGLGGISDDILFRRCCDERRALVTLDHDFGHVLRFPPRMSAGIAILELGPKPGLQSLLDRLGDLAAMLKVQALEGSLWIVEPGRVRIHLED